MSEPTISLAFSDIYADVGEYLFNTRTLTDAQKTEAKLETNRAYGDFLAEADWSFMCPQSSMTLWATATGTMSVSTVTITAAAAAFFPSMVGHTLVADTSENEYTILSYTSSTVVVVDTSAAADDGDTFTITADGQYSLPDNFGSLMTQPAYQPGGDAVGTLLQTSPDQIRHLHSGTSVTANPRRYAVQVRPFTPVTGQRWELFVWPIPVSDRVVHYQYQIIAGTMTTDATGTCTGVHAAGTTTVTATAAAFYPSMIGESIVITASGTYTITAYVSSTVVLVSGDATCTAKAFTTTIGDEYPLGGARHCYTILAGALARAEAKKEGGEGKHAAMYEKRLARSRIRDAENRPRNIGYNSNEARPVGVGRLHLET